MTLDPAAPWGDVPWLICDFETTGVDPLTCAPVSFAAVRFEHGEERGAFYTFLDPGEPIPASATAIHGIADEHVKGAPQLADLAPELLELARGALPFAYNAPYDRTIFHRFIAGNECPLFDPAQRWADPLVIVRKIDRYLAGTGRHKLANICKAYGVPLADAHNAIADVRAVGGLLRAMVFRGLVNVRTPVGKLLDYIDQARAFQDADREKYLAKVRAKAAQQSLGFDGDASPRGLVTADGNAAGGAVRDGDVGPTVAPAVALDVLDDPGAMQPGLARDGEGFRGGVPDAETVEHPYGREGLVAVAGEHVGLEHGLVDAGHDGLERVGLSAIEARGLVHEDFVARGFGATPTVEVEQREHAEHAADLDAPVPARPDDQALVGRDGGERVDHVPLPWRELGTHQF